jgi:hypothetical protein
MRAPLPLCWTMRLRGAKAPLTQTYDSGAPTLKRLQRERLTLRQVARRRPPGPISERSANRLENRPYHKPATAFPR